MLRNFQAAAIVLFAPSLALLRPDFFFVSKSADFAGK